ncbi:HET-R [Byssothecium circinans]|uniref:HET-R n=1 Tax=Byssothecium circinans TaxID=147558 RepID=A0A6A5U504_9PLEO|nr:HET-R [Byssothecium circinans]
MRLLQCRGAGGYYLTELFTNNEEIPPYAILSHTWGADDSEVTFDDLTKGTGADKPGYEKIRFCAAQARQDGLDYFWIDTCCINKENKAELSRAINSMFLWYRKAARCYVYLSDVSTAKRKANSDTSEWKSTFQRSRWFTRGWTLQELLAPRAVEFFSRQHQRLGDKVSLRSQIHEITGIPERALQGEPLSQFSVNDRLSWITDRETKLEEDKAYSLLGIFGVSVPPFYGEGIGRALGRLRDEIDKLDMCTRDLHVTDPRRDKVRIEETKGGLLEESYHWIFQNPDFVHWHNDPQSRLLWIKGDPGKGKTMLLCGIINELSKSTTAKTSLHSYFFCQATDSRINSATAVLRGLLFMLVRQQPSLISKLREKYDRIGKALFEDANAWVVLCEIFTEILEDSTLDNAYFFVDALDECVKDLEKLLAFIVQKSSLFPHIKWIVTSRNYANIEQRLQLDSSGARLSLELKENAAQISRAVDAYIDHRLLELEQIQHDESIQSSVRETMQRKANGTFLWVSLVMKELKDVQAWEVLQVLEEVPTELTEVYRRMVQHIKQLKRQTPELCGQVLSTVVATYRPLHMQELCFLADLPNQGLDTEETTATIVKMCGSFLTVQEAYVYVIHQSATDFLSDEVSVFPSGMREVCGQIVSRSIQIMSRTLRRDMYSLGALGYPIEQVEQPQNDPLGASRYSCVYWINHLCDWGRSSTTNSSVMQDGGAVHEFLRAKHLYWLEALSLCEAISAGVVSLAKLENLLQGRADAAELMQLVHDIRRFLMYHQKGIECSPLQLYGSALLFSPTGSSTRMLFKHEEPNHIRIKPAIGDSWSACLQTLEDHEEPITAVAISHDSAWLASASEDATVKIWDVHSGACSQTLDGFSDYIHSVAFSHDSTLLAIAMWNRKGERSFLGGPTQKFGDDGPVQIYDISSGACLQTFRGHSSVVFSHDSTWLASASYADTAKIWDVSSGLCLQTFEGHKGWVNSVAFSHDSSQLVTAADDDTIKIWDASSGACLQTLEADDHVTSVAFSHDSALLASASTSDDCTIKIWNVNSGACLKTLNGHSDYVHSVAFSHDSSWLVSGSYNKYRNVSGDRTVKIWDVNTGICLQTFQGHSNGVRSVAFSHDSTRLVSASEDCTIKIWDTSSNAHPDWQMRESHSSGINSIVISHDSTRLASASDDHTIKIWDTSSGVCLQTLREHSERCRSVVFSHDSAYLASASYDGMVKIWDSNSGVCLRTFKIHGTGFSALAFSYDSSQLAAASWPGGAVEILDVSSCVCLQTLRGHSCWVNSVAFASDSKRLASVMSDRKVNLWDTRSGKCLTLSDHSDSVASVTFSYDSVASVTFSYDSTLLVTASTDCTIKIRDANSGVCLRTIDVEGTILHLSFDISDSYLHTDFGTIRVSSQSGTRALATDLELQNRPFRGLGLSADGVWITYNSENLVRLPSEYRPSCLVLSDKAIGIGTGAGRVWLCEVDMPEKQDELM